MVELYDRRILKGGLIMESFTKREQVGILVIVLSIIGVLGFKFVIRDIIDRDDNPIVLESGIHEIEEREDLDIEGYSPQIIMVHISGQVYSPGLIEIEEGKRVKDAVDLAGGLKKEADIDKINLAKKLEDEEKIFIPKIGEERDGDMEATNFSSISSDTGGKINLNTCSKVELLSLPGIGDVLADRIIAYRQTAKFTSIDDVKNVSGIGEKKFESIKDLIKVK